jgi:hypothetical protein
VGAAPSVQEQELPYRVEMWDDSDIHVQELISLVADHAVARAAVPTWIYFVSWGMETSLGPLQSPNAGALA